MQPAKTREDRATGRSNGWRRVKFGDMAECVGDRVDNPSEAGVERYVGLEHLDPESLKIRRWGTPDQVEATKLRFKPGDIIFGKRRAYQRKLAVADFEGICSAHAMVLRARENTVVKDFLPVFMQSEVFFERALAISVGSLSPTINWKTLATQQFFIPPKEEQSGIAEILWAAERTISAYAKIVRALRTAFYAVSDSLFTRGIGNHELTTTDFGTLPKTWKLRPLESLVQVDAPICYGIVQVLSHDDEGVPTLAIKNLHGDFRTGIHKSAANIDAQYPRSRVRRGDVLLSIKATVGEVDVVPDHYTGNISRDLAKLRFDSDVLPWFAAHQMQCPRYQQYLNRYVVGSTRKELSIHYIRRLLLAVPPLDEQEQIVSLLSSMKNAIASTEDHLQRVASLKSTLLQELLRV